MEKVSCLMISRPRAPRMPHVRESLACYAGQTHANRELVVVLDGRSSKDDRSALREMVSAIVPAPVKIVDGPDRATLGALRNVAFREASGEILCQWDDDDLQHPGRLATQLAAMREAGCRVSLLQEAMLYRIPEAKLYWTNWAATPAGALPGTLMCEAGIAPAYVEEGPLAELSEDVTLVKDLELRYPIHRLAGAAHLYLYVIHRANTTSSEHHDLLAGSLAISKGLLLRREAALREGLAAFDLPDLCVEGSNGAAFQITPGAR